MLKLCRVNIEHSKEIYRKIEELVKELREKFPIKEIYLYGSFAKGEINEGSDIDLVIVGNFKERFIERIGIILDCTDLPIEPLVYTEEEFEELMNKDNSFIKEVLRTGKKI